MIELRKLKEMIRLMKEYDLSELDIRDEAEQVTIKRANGQTVVAAPVEAVAPVAAPAAAPAPAPAAEGAPAAPAEDDSLVEITSPMVGTFYSAPDPESDPYVKVGSEVGPDSVVCLVEAMKVYNEIKAEVSGTVERVLVGNGDTVEFGQPLYKVRPR